MVWQPYWIYRNTYKNLLSRTAEQIKGKRHRNVLQAMGVQVCSGIIDRLNGFGAILDWRKILNNVFFGTAELIDVKLHIYDIVVVGNTCFLFST